MIARYVGLFSYDEFAQMENGIWQTRHVIARYVGLFSYDKTRHSSAQWCESRVIARYVGLFLYDPGIYSRVYGQGAVIARYVGLFSYDNYSDKKRNNKELVM